MTVVTPTVAPEAPADAAAMPAAALTEIAQVADTALAAITRIVSDKPRHRTISLEYPVECEGKLYEAITVRRLTAKEVADFIAGLKGNPDARWPMYDCPSAVLDAMDDDDALVIDEVTKGFLPQRFQASATPG